MHLTNPSTNYHTNEAVQHLPQYRLLVFAVDSTFFPERINKRELLPTHCKRTTNTLTYRIGTTCCRIFCSCSSAQTARVSRPMLIAMLKRVTYMLVTLCTELHGCSQDLHIYFTERLRFCCRLNIV